MNLPRWTLPIALALAMVLIAPARAATNPILIDQVSAKLEFPDRITFSAHVASDAELERVTLEYGADKQTCGTVVAKAFPDLTPGNAADVTWTWEMRQSGSEPPGTRIWYRWRVTDKAGNERVSERQQITWLDDQHPWKSQSSGMLNLHWYSGSRAFAADLLGAASAALGQLEQTTGIAPEAPIDLYIYANTDDMRDAILYEPGWTGGQAFPDYNSVIIGISADQAEWGRRTEAHELTHVLVGHLTFSCIGSLPTWLNEGIAVYGEGGPQASAQQQLDAAIANDTLLSAHILSGQFSERRDAADLSYGQSYSMVSFLIKTYGRDKLLALFGALRDGMTVEDALQKAYGFGLDQMEQRWRAAVGAKARSGDAQAPPPTAMPTPVPTYPPIDAAPAAAASAPTAPAAPPPAAEPAAAPPAGTPPASQPQPASWANLALIGLGVVTLGAAALLILLGRKHQR
jgi:hypothetical protein